jgi:hypothetical protein
VWLSLWLHDYALITGVPGFAQTGYQTEAAEAAVATQAVVSRRFGPRD